MLTLFNQERVTELYKMELAEEIRRECEARCEAIGKAKGEAIGEVKGEAKGAANVCISLVRKNLLSKDAAAKEMGISVAEFEEKMAACV